MGCEAADNCGPTSEWPTCANDDRGAEGSDDGKGGPTRPTNPIDSNKDDPKPGGNPRDAGKGSNAGNRLDASAPTPGTDGSEYPPTSGGGLHADGGVAFDSGVAFDGGEPTDARVPSIDGGMRCTVDSDSRDAGACYGVYCDLTLDKLSSNAVVGACTSEADLALVCDGEIAREVAQCAQADVLALGFGRTVALCAGRAPSLAAASEACVACYVDDVLCAAEQCFAACVAGSAEECTLCRAASCTPAFEACSGATHRDDYVIIDYI